MLYVVSGQMRKWVSVEEVLGRLDIQPERKGGGKEAAHGGGGHWWAREEE